MIAVGIGLALSSIPVVVWATFAIANVDRSEDAYDEVIEWSWGFEPSLEDEFDRERSFFSLIRVAGLVALVLGAVLAFYGYLLREPSACEESVVVERSSTDGTPQYCESCGHFLGSESAWCQSCGRRRS